MNTDVIFSSEGCQVVDIKKAPIVDVVGRDSPLGETIGLCLDQTRAILSKLRGSSGCPLNALNIFAMNRKHLGRMCA